MNAQDGGGAGAVSRNEISGGAQHAPILQARDFTGPVTITTTPTVTPGPGPAVPTHLQDPRNWPLAANWDALSAGAHRSRPDADGDAVPPYIPRDIDADLRHRLGEAAEAGGLVLLVGDSTAGKTRAAHAAVRDVLPGHRVLDPGGVRDLLAVTGVVARAGVRYLVWLDDLERYLAADGLSPALLAELARLRVPVVATMRVRQYETFLARDHDDRTDTAGRILRMAHPVEVERVWSTAEVRRAEQSADERIEDAVAHHGVHGIAEYLAAGPALLQEWRHASRVGGHPRGGALVSAAVALARTGLGGPYAIELLAGLHDEFLAAAGGYALRPEPLADALAWATRVRHGATSLLVPASEMAYMPFDYLVDHADASVSQQVWEASLAHAADDEERLIIGSRAEREGEYGRAEAAWRPLAEAGHPMAMSLLGSYLGSPIGDDPKEAERFLKGAADAGDVVAMSNYGDLLMRQGRLVEAELIYWRAVDAGFHFAAGKLGFLQLEQGRSEEGEASLRRAVEDPDFTGAIFCYPLARLLEETGRPEEAVEMYLRAYRSGNHGSLSRLRQLPLRPEHLDELTRIYQLMAAGDHALFFDDLRHFLTDLGRPPT
ncbi:sel1 repeat family protein [Streptomyces capitiformicae]|uniref:sel1 repeat family protein n=1 Tax=Streptomyces capitiformicae TaxID=2014920 RepID=UPI001679A77A|nr:sel1 repeat family protein [Streptomyces capitiformicae]